MKANKVIALALTLALLTAVFAGCSGGASSQAPAPGSSAPAPEASGDTIKIGGLAPLTGAVAVYGVASNNGTKLAIEEVNAAGGLLGKQIEYIPYDDKGDTTEVVNAYNRLVSDDKVVAIIGAVTSKPTMSIGAKAAQDGIPVVSPTATALEVTSYGENIFRACFIDPFQGLTMARFAAEKLDAKTAAIMYDTGDDYSVGLMEAFTEAFTAAGGTITGSEGYATGDSDFNAQLTKIAAGKPEVLFLPVYYNDAALIAAQAKSAGITAPLLGADGWDGVVGAVSDAAVIEGAYFCNHFALEDEADIVKNFVSGYQTKYGEDPVSFSALGYDAAKILIAAIEAAGTTDKAAVVDALKNINVDAVTGRVSFDENRNPIKDVSIIKIVDGKNTLFEKLAASAN